MEFMPIGANLLKTWCTSTHEETDLERSSLEGRSKSPEVCPWKFKAQKNIFESFCSCEINIKVSKLLTFVALKKKFSSVISWEIPKNFSRFLRPTQGSLMNLQSEEDIDKSQDTDN